MAFDMPIRFDSTADILATVLPMGCGLLVIIALFRYAIRDVIRAGERISSPERVELVFRCPMAYDLRLALTRLVCRIRCVEGARMGYAPARCVLYALYPVSIVLIVYPFLPVLRYQLNRVSHADEFTDQYYEQKYVIEQMPEDTPERNPHPMGISIDGEEGDRLIVPELAIDTPLITGDVENEALEQGAWLMPIGALPGQPGRTVIAGHRFELNPTALNIFYHLDKLETGDEFYIIFNSRLYKYAIDLVESLPAQEFVYESMNAGEEEVVLYTCTPILSPTHRLILHAGRIPVL